MNETQSRTQEYRMKHSQGHKYILSFDDNEQLMLALHETCEVKQRARPYLHVQLVNVTQPDKRSQNKMLKKFQ